MREVWIKTELPDPLAAALEDRACTMVVVLYPEEVRALRNSINLVGSTVAACSRGARTLQQLCETRGTLSADMAGVLRQMIEALAAAEPLHDTTRQLLGRAVFVSGDGEKDADKGKLQ